MRLLVFHINPNDKSMHILKNEAMFRDMGVDVIEGFDRELLRSDLSGYDAIDLNWFENIDGGAFYMPLLRFVRREIELFRIKRAKVNILFCNHNRFPHNARYPALSRKLYLQLCQRAAVIVAFNDEVYTDLKELFPKHSFAEKIEVVPPLNYIGAYPPKADSETYRLAEQYRGKMIVGFVGKITPYKNVELILRAAKDMAGENIAFLIFGKASSPEYQSELERQAQGIDSVTLRFGTVPDEEMYPLLDVSDVLAMPYDKKSASNSGTGRMAFSYARTVISPDIASMNLIPEELIYKYRYQRNEEHYERFLAALKSAYADWQKDPGSFREKGAELRRIMETQYSAEVIRQKYQSIFSKLSKK